METSQQAISTMNKTFHELSMNADYMAMVNLITGTREMVRGMRMPYRAEMRATIERAKNVLPSGYRDKLNHEEPTEND
jgi:hypothetical protein